MNSPFRVAVIGCGSISKNHVTGIRNAGDTLCALCDIDAEAARRKAAECGVSVPIYTDYAALLDAEQPDAVHICTPHYLHAPMVVEALARGIHVLCEKPLAINEAQLEAVLEAEKNSTAKLGVCLQNRYEPSFRELKKLAADGVSGGVGMMVWKRDEAYYASGAWRGKRATEGGGVLINQSLHTLDLLQWICGMPKALTAHLSNDHLSHAIEVEDTAAVLLQDAGGVDLQFYATTAGAVDFPAQLQVRLANGKSVYADNALLTVDRQTCTAEAGGAPIGKAVWGVRHADLIADFYRCVHAGIRFPINGEEGAKVIRLILAAYRSNGKSVEI